MVDRGVRHRAGPVPHTFTGALIVYGCALAGNRQRIAARCRQSSSGVPARPVPISSADGTDPSFLTSMTSVPSALRSGASFSWRSTQLFISFR